MKNYFNSNLKYIRQQRKMSQNKFAEMLDVNQTTIARWEDENTGLPEPLSALQRAWNKEE